MAEVLRSRESNMRHYDESGQVSNLWCGLGTEKADTRTNIEHKPRDTLFWETIKHITSVGLKT